MVALQAAWRTGAGGEPQDGLARPSTAMQAEEVRTALFCVSRVKPACDPPPGLADRPNSCSGDTLQDMRAWVLVKYKGLMFVKGVEKHVCTNERKSQKISSWYLLNIFGSICQTD